MTQGRVAIALMNRLGATEMIARVYAVTYGLLNIWKVSTTYLLDTEKSHYSQMNLFLNNFNLPARNHGRLV